MRLELTGRHVEITPTLRRLVEGKLARLERMLNDSALSAQVVLSREKSRSRVDITLHARTEKFLHGAGTGPTWQASLGEAVEKIAQQAQTLKGKWQERKRHAAKGAPAAGEAPQPQATAVRAVRVRARMPRILRASRQAIKAMSVADAARALDGRADGVIVFRDVDTSAIAVLYRATGGELTLVETEP
jgi:ribosomal subunit interface protein